MLSPGICAATSLPNADVSFDAAETVDLRVFPTPFSTDDILLNVWFALFVAVLSVLVAVAVALILIFVLPDTFPIKSTAVENLEIARAELL
jgi:ABC-type spermidine/putrescine transport system permease subunit II